MGRLDESVDGAKMTPEQETKLRIVEALSRTDGSLARNDPKKFLESVAIITTFVLETQQKPRTGSKKPARPADKDTKSPPSDGEDMLK